MARPKGTPNKKNGNQTYNYDKKYHYFYKTTNNINGHYYYGVHSTNKLDDGYLGSGLVIQRAIKKYGPENFTKEILKFFDNAADMYEYEASIVTEELVNEDECYNVICGGVNGYTLNDNLVLALDKSTGEVHSYKLDDPRWTTGEIIKTTTFSRFKIGKNVAINENHLYSIDDPRWTTGELIPVTTKGRKTVIDTETGEHLFVNIDDPKYKSDRYQSLSKGMVNVIDKNGKGMRVSVDDPRIKSGELAYRCTGMILSIDKNGKYIMVSVDDPRLKTGELVTFSKGKVAVKDKEGNKFQVSCNDPRYLSGELVPNAAGTMLVHDKDKNWYMVSVDDPRIKSGELLPGTTGMATVRDKNGNTLMVPKGDPRIKSGELTACTKGMSCGIDKDGNMHWVSCKDPRWKTGELVGKSKGFNYYVDDNMKRYYLHKDDNKIKELKLRKLKYAWYKDKEGHLIFTPEDDKRLLNGELVKAKNPCAFVPGERIQCWNTKTFRQAYPKKDDPRLQTGELIKANTDNTAQLKEKSTGKTKICWINDPRVTSDDYERIITWRMSHGKKAC